MGEEFNVSDIVVSCHLPLYHELTATHTLRINLGRPRVIPRQKRQGFNVHRSVKVRMEAGDRVAGGKYVPRAEWKVEPNWVD
jgi:hypothetical protein